jgi:hypothetical protein
VRVFVPFFMCAALSVTGCASITAPDPPAATGSTTLSPVAKANATHEYEPATSPQQRASVWASDPTTIIRAFATAYINWNATTVTARMRALASASVGQARSAMELTATHTSGDYELRRGGIANSGTVEAIAPLQGARDRFVVVTQERTTATNASAYQGLRPAWHLTIATVEQMRPGAWVVSGWQPET